jgi:hypothetical protein
MLSDKQKQAIIYAMIDLNAIANEDEILDSFGAQEYKEAAANTLVDLEDAFPDIRPPK